MTRALRVVVVATVPLFVVGLAVAAAAAVVPVVSSVPVVVDVVAVELDEAVALEVEEPG